MSADTKMQINWATVKDAEEAAFDALIYGVSYAKAVYKNGTVEYVRVDPQTFLKQPHA